MILIELISLRILQPRILKNPFKSAIFSKTRRQLPSISKIESYLPPPVAAGVAAPRPLAWLWRVACFLRKTAGMPLALCPRKHDKHEDMPDGNGIEYIRYIERKTSMDLVQACLGYVPIKLRHDRSTSTSVQYYPILFPTFI